MWVVGFLMETECRLNTVPNVGLFIRNLSIIDVVEIVTELLLMDTPLSGKCFEMLSGDFILIEKYLMETKGLP